ncbi:PilZ domain-containing protein [Salinarimonas sp.]|uniref:PilZ domain-containing protein n=1 Tax=Salinarimonas sp. TaxID=2766526 RepID=UPI0032D93BC9
MSTATHHVDEHRGAPRRRTLMSAQIRYSGGAVTADCVVRNISDTGAKIDVSAGIVLPERFDLVIPQKNVVHACELRWRRAAEAGVAFLDATGQAGATGAPAALTPRTTPTEDALKARIRQLEEENARLRGRIVELGGA